MIVDAFIFNNEYDLLDVRLNELKDVVDLFLIVEAVWTFRGNPRKDSIHNNFIFSLPESLKAKILALTIVKDPFSGRKDSEANWGREIYQRNGISRFLLDKNLDPEDIVIISDVDEIPRASIFKDLKKIKETTTLSMDMYYYGLNIYDGKWGGAKALRYKNLYDAHSVRHSYTSSSIDNAGWHFSYLGDEEFIMQKIQSFSHSELDTPDIVNKENIRKRMNNQEDLWGHGKKYQKVEIDNTYPQHIVNNIEYYKKYII